MAIYNIPLRYIVFDAFKLAVSLENKYVLTFDEISDFACYFSSKEVTLNKLLKVVSKYLNILSYKDGKVFLNPSVTVGDIEKILKELDIDKQFFFESNATTDIEEVLQTLNLNTFLKTYNDLRKNARAFEVLYLLGTINRGYLVSEEKLLKSYVDDHTDNFAFILKLCHFINSNKEMLRDNVIEPALYKDTEYQIACAHINGFCMDNAVIKAIFSRCRLAEEKLSMFFESHWEERFPVGEGEASDLYEELLDDYDAEEEEEEARPSYLLMGDPDDGMEYKEEYSIEFEEYRSFALNYIDLIDCYFPDDEYLYCAKKRLLYLYDDKDLCLFYDSARKLQPELKCEKYSIINSNLIELSCFLVDDIFERSQDRLFEKLLFIKNCIILFGQREIENAFNDHKDDPRYNSYASFVFNGVLDKSLTRKKNQE